VDAADELLGWESATVDLYSEAEDTVRTVFEADVIDGRRVRIAEKCSSPCPATPMARRVALEGAKLILRDSTNTAPGDMVAFGDVARRSSSLIFVPMRTGSVAVGVLSIQSYTPHAYDERDLRTVQALADHCGGALQRTSFQKALADSERQYRLLVEKVNDGIVIATDGRLRFINDRFARMLGYEVAELLGADYVSVFAGGSPPLPGHDVLLVAPEGEVSARYETQMLRRDGSVVDVEVNVALIPDYEGAPASFAVVRDSSERKAAEKERFRSNALYETLINSSEDYIFLMDRDMRYLQVNDAIEKRYGIRKSERVGRTLYELVEGEQLEFYAGHIRKVFTTGQPVRYDDQGIVRGRFISTETLLSPIFDREGNVDGVVGVSRENTERRSAEQALRESEERYALATRGANDGIWDWNLQTNQIYYAPRWIEMLGLEQSKVSDGPHEWFDRVHPDDLPQLHADMDAHLSGACPHFENEHRMRHGNGEDRWMLARGLCVPRCHGQGLPHYRIAERHQHPQAC
jgi:PAS domain S-box-containing protein